MSDAEKKEEARLDAIITKENRNAKCLLCDYIGTCPPAVCQHLKKVHEQKMKKDTNWDYTQAAPTSATKVAKQKQGVDPQTYSNPLFATEKFTKMNDVEFLAALEKMYSRPTAIDREYTRVIDEHYNSEFEDYLQSGTSGIFSQKHICGKGCHHVGDTNDHGQE